MRVIDLSQEIYHLRPVPGSQPTVCIWTQQTHEETAAAIGTGFSFTSKGLILSDHCSTHVDAFCHIDPRPGAESIDQMPLELFFSEAICVDLSQVAAGQAATKEQVQRALEATGLQIKKGDAFLYYTGQSARTGGAEYTAFASLSGEAVEWLADQGVANIGTEAYSIDQSRYAPNATVKYPAHTVCRDRRILNVENLAIPQELVGKRFKFMYLPLKIRGATGSPVRAVAILED